MQRYVFPSGITLYRSEFRVEKSCVIEARNDAPRLANLLCVQCNLSGCTAMQPADGKEYTTDPEHGLLFRVPSPGARIVHPGRQLIRHVGVSGPAASTLKRLGTPTPEPMTCFRKQQPQPPVVRRFELNNRLRKMLSAVFTSQARGPAHPLALEGMAMTIYAEAIQHFVDSQTQSPEPQLLWEENILGDVIRYLRSHLELPLQAEDITRKFGISKYRLNALFQNRPGASFARFLRRERLQEARRLIQEEELAVKAAAFAVGYKHVSNFTLAYRQFFGETPGQTRKLGCIEIRPHS